MGLVGQKQHNVVKLEKVIFFKDLTEKNEKCAEKTRRDCVLDENRYLRFLKNAVINITKFDLYIYSVIIGILLIIGFIFIIIRSIVKRCVKAISFLFKRKSKKE